MCGCQHRQQPPPAWLAPVILAGLIGESLGTPDEMPCGRRQRSAVEKIARKARADRLAKEREEERRKVDEDAAARRAAREERRQKQDAARIKIMAEQLMGAMKEAAPAIGELVDAAAGVGATATLGLTEDWHVVSLQGQDGVSLAVEAVKAVPGGWLYRTRARIGGGRIADNVVMIPLQGYSAADCPIPHGWPAPLPLMAPPPRTTGEVARKFVEQVERVQRRNA